MAIDLLKIQPHKVSRDLSGYITYVYGVAKCGKTTFAARASKCLILATEKGYSALDGVMAQDINTWSDIRSVLRELRKPEVKEMFSVIAVDTVDLAQQSIASVISVVTPESTILGPFHMARALK